MASAWRIVKAKHSNTAFSGEGARLNGGRWNSVGRAVVYVSAHQSLAALEILVHARPLLPTQKYHAFQVEWDDALTEKIRVADLPGNWRQEPPPRSIQEIGDRWLQRRTAPVLAVPSTILPMETNFLLNPAHPDFKKITIHQGITFTFDPRLLHPKSGDGKRQA